MPEKPTPKPDRISALFREDKKRREFSVSVDADTYDLITRVSKQTGKSRPKVLAAFVKTAYDAYVEAAEDNGVDPEPFGDNDKPEKKNGKGRRKRDAN